MSIPTAPALRDAAAPTPFYTAESRAASPRARWIALVVAALALTLAIGALWAQATQPTDNVYARLSLTSWPRDGIPAALIAPQPGGIVSGDVLIAIDGRSMESWADNIFTPNAPFPRWQVGEQHIYTVLRGGHRLAIPVTVASYPLGEVLSAAWSTTLFALALAVVAGYVFVRRPREQLAAPLLVAAASLVAATVGYQRGLAISDIVTGSGFWLYVATMIVVYDLFLASMLHTTLLFPQPHPLVATRRWLIPLLYMAVVPISLGYLALTRALAGSTVQWLGLWQPGERTVALVYEGLIALTVIASYRASRDAVVRQQIRWVVFGGAIAAGGTVVFWILPVVLTGHAILTGPWLGVLQIAFPVSLAIAILRHRLFDIDVLINRALVYGTLTAILAGVYFGMVILLGTLVRDFTGQAGQHPLVIVGSTLLIASLFQPARRRIQIVIDRRFYRRKYDAARTVAAFSTTLRHELNLEDLCGQLVAVVEETMQPTSVSLWLREPSNNAAPDLPPPPADASR